MYLAAILVIAIIVFSIFVMLKRPQPNEARTTRHQQKLASRTAPKFALSPDSEIDADAVLGLSETEQVANKVKNVAPQYISLFLHSKYSDFAGYELLQALLANGLRYGKHHLFHHQNEFSLASSVAPGTFDMQKMGSFHTPCLSLFVMLNETADPLVAFDSMLETAYALAEDLNGELLDNQRQPLDKVTISKWRKQVKHYIETQTVGDLFATTTN